MAVSWDCFSICRSRSSSWNNSWSFLRTSPTSTGSRRILPFTSGRTLTCSEGVISPAALTAKRMLRVSSVAVVGRPLAAATVEAAVCFFCQTIQPPNPRAAIKSNAPSVFMRFVATG